MQAIVTKYIAPTNMRGGRIRVKCDARTAVYGWDHALDVRENHYEAARRLCAELDWLDRGAWELGSLPDGCNFDYAFVCRPG